MQNWPLDKGPSGSLSKISIYEFDSMLGNGINNSHYEEDANVIDWIATCVANLIGQMETGF